jgi:hypothetical protein
MKGLPDKQLVQDRAYISGMSETGCLSLRLVSLCSKPGCAGAAAAVLSYDYASSRAVLEDPAGMVDPHLYVLCARCADKLVPPRGWELVDRRNKPPLFLPRDPATTTVEIVDVIGEDHHAQAEPEPRSSRQLFFGHSA